MELQYTKEMIPGNTSDTSEKMKSNGNIGIPFKI